DKALDKLANASADYLVQLTGKGDLGGITDLDGNITIDIVMWQVLGNGRDGTSAQNDVLDHEFVHSATSRYWKNEWDTKYNNKPGMDAEEFKRRREGADTRIHNSSGSKTKRCVQGDASCTDSCNGMARQTQQAVACLDKVLNPETIPPTLDDL